MLFRSRLHDIFHEAVRAGWPGRDNPQSAVGAMLARVEGRYIELIAQDSSLNLEAVKEPK